MARLSIRPSPWWARPTPARQPFSTASPDYARGSATFLASPSSTTPAASVWTRRRSLADRSSRRLQSQSKSEDEKVTVNVLNGEMPGAERPDAIILVLDSNNLNRHLVLAGRVIALGLPTLVLLNMADELHKQGGQVDVLPLARQLGTPVALVSAVTGEGLEAVANFLVATPQIARTARVADLRRSPPLPRMGRANGFPCRLPARRNPGVDAPPGFDLPPQILGRSDLCRRHRRRLPDHLSSASPPATCCRSCWTASRFIFERASPRPHQFAGRQRSMEGRRIGAGFSAADSSSLPRHRHPGRFRLPGASRGDLGQGDGQGRPETESRSSLCSPPTVARSRPSWRPVRSKTSATASPQF